MLEVVKGARAADGENLFDPIRFEAEGLTTEEMIEVVEALAAGRASAQIASTTSRTTKATAKAANGPIAQSTLDDIFGALS